jgi:hypothetical protein
MMRGISVSIALLIAMTGSAHAVPINITYTGIITSGLFVPNIIAQSPETNLDLAGLPFELVFNLDTALGTYTNNGTSSELFLDPVTQFSIGNASFNFLVVREE